MPKKTFFVKDCYIRIKLSEEFLVRANEDDIQEAIEEYLQAHADFNDVDNWELASFDILKAANPSGLPCG